MEPNPPLEVASINTGEVIISPVLDTKHESSSESHAPIIENSANSEEQAKIAEHHGNKESNPDSEVLQTDSQVKDLPEEVKISELLSKTETAAETVLPEGVNASKLLSKTETAAETDLPEEAKISELFSAIAITTEKVSGGETLTPEESKLSSNPSMHDSGISVLELIDSSYSNLSASIPEESKAPLNPSSETAEIPDLQVMLQEIPAEEQEWDGDLPPPPPPMLFREPSSSDPEAPESTHGYFQHLGTLRLQMSDWSSESLSTYIYDDSPMGPEGLSRINKEIKALTRALPCEPSGAVFVSIDSSNLSRLKVLISGTEDTPYEHGLYLFDIKLDPNYPNSPPKMTIKTTGGGLLRFNPNLYDSGYVCLSIINTWGGDPEEMWNPSYSTLMQVFLSIQALVMNNDVIQKEPGYEHMETASPENQDYAGIVKYGNISYAMIEMLRQPPEDFKEIVVKHFALKKEKILKSVEKWVEESEQMGGGYDDYILSCHNATAIAVFKEKGAKSIFSELFEELRKELDKLPSI